MRDINSLDSVRAMHWLDDGLELLDQRKLPGEVCYLRLSTAGEVARAIADMVVRGAPAIGITAAYGVALAAREAYAQAAVHWREAVQPALEQLAQARPTAVNLRWALSRMRALFADIDGDPTPALLAEAAAIQREDLAANRRMGELGASMIGPGARVLTHCNTGSLATGGFGTALGVIRTAYAKGRMAKVYATETRPWLQGARLTAWELAQDGIPVSLLADSAAAYLMQRAAIDWVIVGADRIAANGSVANKIGTYALALAAQAHDVRFMVVAPSSTVDMGTPSGDEIQIEQRPPSEVLTFNGIPLAAQGADAWNPVFDVTPSQLIDVIVTERGLVHQPGAEAVARLMGRG
ncbi:MAG: S-methyl-5-thioribose-1-phosphate isomerase [Gammaproteobacteria bacterium]